MAWQLATFSDLKMNAFGVAYHYHCQLYQDISMQEVVIQRMNTAGGFIGGDMSEKFLYIYMAGHAKKCYGI